MGSESGNQTNKLDKIPAEEIANYNQVVDGLKYIYQKKVKPIEEKYKFDYFHSPMLRDADFDAKPMILLLGQYSTGKTSFIEYMLDREFPGQRVGPEPTTDRFVAVMHGTEDRIIPGNALSVDADKPFHALNKFGNGFLSKFESSECPSPILEKVTFIDTPGVLSGEKQRIGRSYDFTEISEWFSERSDLILLLFDAHKLDISDEFKRIIESLRGQDDKIRVILNKADCVNTQQLMRVYGALMWSLGKVLKTPEVIKVHIGSFKNKPLQIDENKKLFDAEQGDLLKDLLTLPRNSAVRKVNELVKRARLVKTHMYILAHLKNEMPALFGKDSKKNELIAGLDKEFKNIERINRLPPGDFPEIEKFRLHLKDHDFTDFPKLSEKLVATIDEVLSKDLPKLMGQISPHEQRTLNPFDEAPPSETWDVSATAKAEYDKIFNSLNPVNNKLSGAQLKQTLINTNIDQKVLRPLWALADLDKDGSLDTDEFAIAMHLIRTVKAGNPLPDTLPPSLIPPHRR